MDAARWPQDVKMAKSMEEMSSNTCSRPILERKARPQEQLNCPRCNSTNTKFCYYNNYSLTQPRYFCKTCRRYWTEGGSLRNVPVGGGSRKNKRSSSSSSSASSSALSSKLPDLNPPSIALFPSQNPNNLEGQDLNLAIPATIHETQALELLRTGIASRGLNSYIPTPMPDTNTLYSSVYPIQEDKPTLGFAVEGLEVGNRYGGNGGRILFPLAELKNMSTAAHDDHEVDRSKGQETTNTNITTSNGFWSGMFGGGGGPW